MKVSLAEGFILHRRPFRETSVMIEVLTRDYGRLSMIAKGSKSNKRGQAGLLQLYQPLLLSWSGNTDLYTVTGLEAAGPAYLLQAKATLCGLYINELMVKLLPQAEPESALFDGYQHALAGLQSDQNNEITLRLFEKQLLTQLGYGLAIEHEHDTGKSIDTTQDYYYIADSGLHRWQSGMQHPKISGRSLQHLTAEHGFDQHSLKEIKQLMRAVIQFYLAGRPLQSRALFSQFSVNTKEKA